MLGRKFYREFYRIIDLRSLCRVIEKIAAAQGKETQLWRGRVGIGDAITRR